MQDLIPSGPPALPTALQMAQLGIAIDAGNANTKIRAVNQAIEFRSVLATVSKANRLNTWPVADVMRFNGDWWVAGDPAYTHAPENVQENTTVTRYTSAWYRTLFAFALHKVLHPYAGQGIISPRIISSVPAEIYKNQAETNEIKAKLTGHYDIMTVNGKILQVEIEARKLTILPEGIGTYFERVYGQPDGIEYRKGVWAMADLGYLTFDLVVMRKDQYVPSLSRSDEHSGLSLVAEAVRDYVFRERRLRLGRSEIDTAMSQDEIRVNGKPMDVSQIRAKALTELSKRIALLLEQWTAGLNLDGIILTGGGARPLAPYLHLGPAFPTVQVADHRANVDGTFLYLMQAAVKKPSQA